MRDVLVAGGGVGGLAAALACARGGNRVRLLEKASAFGEVGAGIQLGPNALAVLHQWGLLPALQGVAAFPQRLVLRDAQADRLLAQLPLGHAAQQRYGQPHATVHRADLHALLLHAVQAEPQVTLTLGSALAQVHSSSKQAQVQTEQGQRWQADALIACDGLWSRARQCLLGDGAPLPTGHLAYRACVPQAQVPLALRSSDITVWMGPLWHVVRYPVRSGDWLNVVVIVHGQADGDVQRWDRACPAQDVQRALHGACAPVAALAEAMAPWCLWALYERAPLTQAAQYVHGCAALLGDAAHPMRPYMAQGASMALEDAWALGMALQDHTLSVTDALQTYAQQRCQRNARVQRKAQRNGGIFHATGLMRAGRDWSLRLLGERLLDTPWLYRGPGASV